MSSERKVYRLEELCEFVNGFAFKSSDYVEQSDETWEVLRMGYINRGGGFKEDTTPVFVPRAYGKDLGKYLIRPDDIVIAMTDMKNNVAILGNTARIRDANRFVLNQRVGCIRVKPMGLADPSFLYYYSNWQPHVDYLRARANSGVQVNLSTPAIREAKIELPPLAEQISIGSLLSVLDDRIALLRETNATLEAIAQALFKSWFVDFDPVRAKMEGRTPEGMGEATAALFPDGFETSELGEVPRGWRESTIGELIELTKGCSYKGDSLSEVEGAYMFNLGCFNAHRVFASEKVKRYTGEYKLRHAVQAGDLIIANTDMTQARDILGRPAFVPMGFDPSFISHHVYKVIVRPEWQEKARAIRNLLFFALQESAFRERAIGFATGTTVLALPSTAVLGSPAPIPTTDLLDVFDGSVQPIFETISINEQRVATLTETRDTLLPRLISGQLGLPEAQNEIIQTIE